MEQFSAELMMRVWDWRSRQVFVMKYSISSWKAFVRLVMGYSTEGIFTGHWTAVRRVMVKLLE
jgi:hypothetical protein